MAGCRGSGGCSSSSNSEAPDQEFIEAAPSTHKAPAASGCDGSDSNSDDKPSDDAPQSIKEYEHAVQPAPPNSACSPTTEIQQPPTKTTSCSQNTCCVRKLPSNSSETKTSQCGLDDLKDDYADSPVVIEIDSPDTDGSISGIERIVLRVQGMTCTGCEQKLQKTLESIKPITNVKTSLLLEQVEFDLDCSPSLNAGSIVKVLESKTGFTCTRIVRLGEELDLLLDSTVLSSRSLKLRPHGVIATDVLGKGIIRVSYDPRVIGARELLFHEYYESAKLRPLSSHDAISGRSQVYKSLGLTILSAILTIPVLVLAYGSLSPRPVLYGAISLGLATIVQLLIAGPFYIRAYKTLVFTRMIEMDMVVVLSTTAAYVYSVIAYALLVAKKPLSTGQFFETSTLLITLIMVGRTVAEYARQRAVESISIESLQTQTAMIVNQRTGTEKEIDARLLQYGDTFKVSPHMAIVTDGTVSAGETEVDESMITGESTLIVKQPGMEVIAGSLNHSGSILVQLTRLPSENTIKTISTMVDEAKSSKAKVQEIADRVASYFVPAILGVTILVFIVWVAVGKAVRNQSNATACITAMTYAISALIVSCPCAIGLAVPMVVVIAGGVAARHGLIIKTSETIELGRKVTHVIFDKTGTLTQGKLSVVEEDIIDTSPEVASMILGLASNSKHPVALAIIALLESRGVIPSHVSEIDSIVGKGIQGRWNGKFVRAGNPFWLGQRSAPQTKHLLPLGLSIFCVTIDGVLAAIYGLRDSLRPDALSVINELRRRNISISLISGDNPPAVLKTATEFGIPLANTRFQCDPEAKQDYVKELLQDPKNTVLFCGDGTNDAVALAQASIGMHINSGTDIAKSAADAVLMRPSLKGVITLIDLSEAFYRRVVFNFVWSGVYNLFAILLAAGAFPNVRIPPRYAGLGELASVLPVILVALQLRLVKF